jgi:hypothetical protein
VVGGRRRHDGLGGLRVRDDLGAYPGVHAGHRGGRPCRRRVEVVDQPRPCARPPRRTAYACRWAAAVA